MGRIAVLVEGAKREIGYFECLGEHFFQRKNVDIVFFPAEQNIYMLWSKMKDDDAIDIIELVREYSREARDKLNGYMIRDFEEIYLFFDFDAHQRNLPDGVSPDDAITQMLETFNNETENGKLYISYPMVEALRDISEWNCKAHYKCGILVDEYARYKEETGKNNMFSQVEKYSKDTWHMIVAIFLARYCCLTGKLRDSADFAYCLREYKSAGTPGHIFEKIRDRFARKREVFVLSALPEFLVDYFKTDYWEWLNNSGKGITYPFCNYAATRPRPADVAIDWRL